MQKAIVLEIYPSNNIRNGEDEQQSTWHMNEAVKIPPWDPVGLVGPLEPVPTGPTEMEKWGKESF